MYHEYNERNARALFELFNRRLDQFGVLIDNEHISRDVGRVTRTTLAKMLESGGFPVTESNAVLEAYNALCDAVADLEMSLLVPFEMEEMERTHSEHEAGIAAGTICPQCGQKK